MSKTRGFETITEKHRKQFEDVTTPEGTDRIYTEITHPTRADTRSAGYDFYAPQDFSIQPGEQLLVWTDVKAYMQDGEVLKLYPRSSHGTKKNIMLANTVGIIDASYYENTDNDGNIGIALRNNGDKVFEIKAGDRFAQGIFTPYLLADDDIPTSDTRIGGFGSSDKQVK